MSTRTIDGPTGVLRHRLLDRRAFLLKGGLTAAAWPWGAPPCRRPRRDASLRSSRTA